MIKEEYEEFMKFLCKELAQKTLAGNLKMIKKVIKKRDIEKALNHKLKKEFDINLLITVNDGTLRFLYSSFVQGAGRNGKRTNK